MNSTQFEIWLSMDFLQKNYLRGRKEIIKEQIRF